MPLFFQGPRCKFEEKKLHLGPVALWGATGGIFEIFQNRHIFLKFLFFKNIKKKKVRQWMQGELKMDDGLALWAHKRSDGFLFFLLKFRKISIDEDVECDWVVESFMARRHVTCSCICVLRETRNDRCVSKGPPFNFLAVKDDQLIKQTGLGRDDKWKRDGLQTRSCWWWSGRKGKAKQSKVAPSHANATSQPRQWSGTSWN